MFSLIKRLIVLVTEIESRLDRIQEKLERMNDGDTTEFQGPAEGRR